MIQAFISHSSRDHELLDRLIKLVRSATRLPSDLIRCTSLDGYRLAGGASTDEVLRREIHESTAFVALLTPNSISSIYVLFELGARWATRKPLIPLIAGGTAQDLLQGPLAGLSALSCDSEDQLCQFIEELGVMLQRNTEGRAAYQKCLNQVVEAAQTLALETSAQDPDAPLSEDAQRLLLEVTDDSKGEIHDVSMLNGRMISTQYALFAQMDDPKAGVRWKRALDELVERKFVESKYPGPDAGSVFLLTEDGRWAADYLRRVRPSRDLGS